MPKDMRQPITFGQSVLVLVMASAVGWLGATFATMYRDSGASSWRDKEVDKLDARIQSLETALRNCH